MSKINEKVLNDIREMLDGELGRDANSIFSSSGYKRMLEQINDDEEFRAKMETSVKSAFEALEKTRSYDFSVLDRKGLMSLFTSIDLVRHGLTRLTEFKFYGDVTGYTVCVIKELKDFDERVEYLQDDNDDLEKLGAKKQTEDQSPA